jgi:serine/threonine protein kinase
VSEKRRRVGRYEILREIGRGGMGIVFLARQTELDRLVALKELAAFQADDSTAVRRFLSESRLAGSLAHPNIVTVHDYFEHERKPYISMEYMERGSLRPYVGRMRLAQIVGVLEGLLAGLEHAAGRQIVHRDLKPENVMVSSAGRVKITDFGIAKARDRITTGPLRTAPGTAVGTPAYIAPEQATGSQLGPWTDLYSLGVMAYEMLAGRVPFHGTETPMAILFKHVNEPVPPPRWVKPELDEGLAEWLERLLEKRPPTATRTPGRLGTISRSGRSRCLDRAGAEPLA